MAAIPCENCGNLRKTEVVWTPDGWAEPPCYNCGDPSFIKPLDEKELNDEGLSS